MSHAISPTAAGLRLRLQLLYRPSTFEPFLINETVVRAVRATRVSDAMFMAAARALADTTDATDPGQSILPSLQDIRAVSRSIAVAVARQAMAEGLAPELDDVALDQAIDATIWHAEYRPYVPTT